MTSLLLDACNLPRDADGTLERVRGHELHVGLIMAPPQVVDSLGTPRGAEVQLVTDLARTLGARVVWVRWPPDALMHGLHARELDLVVGGLTAASPWKSMVGFTQPYATDTTTVPAPGDTLCAKPAVVLGEARHVFAVPPGENAWLLHVDRFLHQRATSR